MNREFIYTLPWYSLFFKRCINSIEGGLIGLNGVKSVKVYLTDGKVDVAFDSNILCLKRIAEVIEDQGYDVIE